MRNQAQKENGKLNLEKIFRDYPSHYPDKSKVQWAREIGNISLDPSEYIIIVKYQEKESQSPIYILKRSNDRWTKGSELRN